MKITRDLIQKFLENRCTAEEANAVAQHLNRHPELMAMYVRSSWDAAATETELPPGYTTAMLETITTQIHTGKRTIRLRRWVAAAASLLVVSGAAWLFKTDSKAAKQPLATVRQPADSIGWKQHANTTAHVYSLPLPDGSVVKLAPAAVIKYKEPFETNSRNIYMAGEADFEVAHDKTRPFTVHAQLFATTALGTSFRVSQNAVGCTIKLFTGKVIIKALINDLKGWSHDVVLSPGNEMKYNLTKGKVTVAPFHTKQALPHQSVTNAKAQDENKLVFDNTPLPAVMDALINKYQLPIQYDRELLAGKYFSGEVLATDSLSVLLKVIANMNGLQITQQDHGYIITNSK